MGSIDDIRVVQSDIRDVFEKEVKRAVKDLQYQGYGRDIEIQYSTVATGSNHTIRYSAMVISRIKS
ncbi:sporulation protein [Bacillus phage Kirov]|uniref:Sporulation protein n=1 Tax=Bacillus phage Kirov TaxID=2783539 RepID=A0A7U3NKF4_9CAUD|nr:sporulation protein [Bacillus phage Kirov]QOV08284.1 sporulation protein [Bacillus phage Kirov]